MKNKTPNNVEFNNIVFTSSINENYTTYAASSLNTTNKDVFFSGAPIVRTVIGNVVKSLKDIPTKAVQEYAVQFCQSFQEVLIAALERNKVSAGLPALSPSILEDGSFLIQWVFKDFRIGFSIEPIIEESSWYMVKFSKFNEVQSSGPLILDSLKAQIYDFIIFSLRNS